MRPDDVIRLRHARSVAIAHGIPLMITLMFCWFFIPELPKYIGVDPNPSGPTLFIFELARLMKKHALILFSLTGVIVLGDTLVYVLLHSWAKKGAFAWFWFVLALVISVALFTVWTMHRPLFIFPGAF